MLQEMMHQLLTPEVVSCRAAASACQKGKQWEEALGKLHEMVHQFLPPDMLSAMLPSVHVGRESNRRELWECCRELCTTCCLQMY